MAEASDAFGLAKFRDAITQGKDTVLDMLTEGGIDITSEISQKITEMFLEDGTANSAFDVRGFWKETLGKKQQPAAEFSLWALITDWDNQKETFFSMFDGVSTAWNNFKGWLSGLGGDFGSFGTQIAGYGDMLFNMVKGWLPSSGGDEAPQETMIAGNQQSPLSSQQELEVATKGSQPGAGLDGATRPQEPFQVASHQTTTETEEPVPGADNTPGGTQLG